MLMFTACSSYSQNDDGLDIQPFTKLLVKTNFRLPFARSNNFVKNVTDGVVDLQGSINYSVVKNVYVGVGYRYGYFKFSETKLNSVAQNQFKGTLEQKGMYGELSYFYDLYDNLAIEANFQVGMENTVGNSILLISNGGKTSNKGVFYSPNLNIYLKTEEVFSFFFSVGYNFSSTRFTPETVGAVSFDNYSEADFLGTYRHLNIGFGMGITLKKPERN